MKQFLARVLETEFVSPELLRVAFAANEFPPSQPGQFFLVRQDSPYLDPYLRRVWFAPRVVGARVEFWLSDTLSLRATEGSPNRTTEGSPNRTTEGSVAIPLQQYKIASSHPSSALRTQDIFDFIGPLGRGFQIPRETKHLLVVEENASFAAPLIGLIEMLVQEERELVAVCGEPALPEFLIPPEVEYRVAPRTFDAFGDAWQWADALIASGTRAFYDELKRVAPRRLPAQTLLSDMLLPCGVGACFTCAVETREGMRLVCRDGPVFEMWSAVQ